ncbi:integrase core domain-containing protein [Rhodococcus jostii]|uniref:integrase core domain-containing protein n=1 Tax=Rhodococcus jostii TaxID=132919 RepID=UPI00362D8F1B
MCWDNAVTESLWSSLERELLQRYRWPTRAAARQAIFAWIHRYNRHRLRSSLGYLPPVDYEQQYRNTRFFSVPKPHNQVPVNGNQVYQCAVHVSMHGHYTVCTDACRRCESAGRELIFRTRVTPCLSVCPLKKEKVVVDEQVPHRRCRIGGAAAHPDRMR